tara:strand:+ start:633 stop:1022 length:390 start_codon:yes stop_codon:yes gene_type:complete
MKIVRGGYEHQAIAQVLMESLYLLDAEDSSGIRCFNVDEMKIGTWGRFACLDTATEVLDELFDCVYNDKQYYSVPDYMECYEAAKHIEGSSEAIDPRRNALAAVVAVDNEYLDDLCVHIGYELVDKEEV